MRLDLRPIQGSTVAMVLLAILLLGSATRMAGQAEDEQETSLRTLRERVEERYRVLSAEDGIALIPLYDTDAGLIELTDGDIAIDGEPVTGAELRTAVGEDTEAILRLSNLDGATRRMLFGIGPPPDAAAPDEPERAERRDRGQMDRHGERVRVGGSVRIGVDEFIDGDVVAVGGSAHVDGQVTGDVTAIGGSVHLGPQAEIDGDVMAVGGRVHKSASTIVRGSTEETPFGAPNAPVARVDTLPGEQEPAEEHSMSWKPLLFISFLILGLSGILWSVLGLRSPKT